MNFSPQTSSYQYQNPYTNEMTMNIMNSHPNKKIKNPTHSVSEDLRIVSLENRVETMEKMLKYLDEFIHLKEEEKNNEFQITNNESINILNNQVQNLQMRLDNSQIDEIPKQIEIINNKLGIQNSNFSFNKKRDNIRDILNQNNYNKYSQNIELMQNRGNFLNEKIQEVDGLLRKNDNMIDQIIKEKLYSINIQTQNKINEILNVIQDINKITEENEFAINELKEHFRKIQQENIDVIKEMSIQTEKLKQIDYAIEQIGQMKEKYGKLISIFDDNQKEEDKFIEQYLGPKEIYNE
jgi:hypothetical protein